MDCRQLEGPGLCPSTELLLDHRVHMFNTQTPSRDADGKREQGERPLTPGELAEIPWQRQALSLHPP